MEQPGQSSHGCSRAWREIFGTQKEIEFSLLKDGDSNTHQGFLLRYIRQGTIGDTEGQAGV